MNTFTKPAYSIEQHITLLRQRGLIIDEQSALHHLSNISFFRLSAYTRPFYTPKAENHIFIQGTRFDDILNLYVFDRELRLFIMDAIERLEVALRTQLGNTLAEHHTPHGYLDLNVFDTRYNHNWLINKLKAEVKGRNVESFVEQYRSIYRFPEEPPIWMTVELLTFKEVSTMFANLRHIKDTQRIEKYFGWKFPVLRSWFRCLSDLRNCCAHHARTWNREFGSVPVIPKKNIEQWPTIPNTISINNGSIDPRRRLYVHLVVIKSLLKVVCPDSDWANRLINLLKRFPNIPLSHMGFPSGWNKEDFWVKK